jgi:hypothetical protein
MISPCNSERDGARCLRAGLNESGMSLLSVIFILFISSLMVAVGYLNTAPIDDQSRMSQTIARMEKIQAAVALYRTHNGAAPATLDALVTRPPATPVCSVDSDTASASYRTLRGWCGPYIDVSIQQAATLFKTDGWGMAFQYSATTLRSCGQNRVCLDGDDIIIDL